MPESLGWQLRAALPPLRLHSVSVFDLEGDVLWLSEGALGPDEQNFVIEALDELKASPSGTHRESDFRDGRGAIFLAVRAQRSALVGLVMILVDGKALAAGGLAMRVMTPPVHAVLQRLAMWLYPKSKGAADAAPGAELEEDAPAPTERAAPSAHIAPVGPAASADAPAPVPKRVDATGTISMEMLATQEILAPREVDEILTFELPKETLPAGATAALPTPPTGATAVPAVPAVPTATPADPARAFALQVQELVKLRPGGRMRRFQVVTGTRSAPTASTTSSTPGDAADALLAQLRELASWLGANPHLTERAPLAFSLEVPASAMEVERLGDLITDCLQETFARTESIGFSIEESVYVRLRAQTTRLVETVERLAGFLVVDNFAFDSAALDLLRSKALRLVKVEPELVAAALRDKLAQARIVAISQAARVLGVHCSAKRVAGEATRRWLAAAGFDFAEGPLFEAPVTLASLAAELADRR